MSFSRRRFIKSATSSMALAWGGVTITAGNAGAAELRKLLMPADGQGSGAGFAPRRFIYGTQFYRPPSPPREKRREHREREAPTRRRRRHEQAQRERLECERPTALFARPDEFAPAREQAGSVDGGCAFHASSLLQNGTLRLDAAQAPRAMG